MIDWVVHDVESSFANCIYVNFIAGFQAVSLGFGQVCRLRCSTAPCPRYCGYVFCIFNGMRAYNGFVYDSHDLFLKLLMFKLNAISLIDASFISIILLHEVPNS